MRFYAAVVGRKKTRGKSQKHYLIASHDPLSVAIRISNERREKLQVLVIVGQFESLDDSERFCGRLAAKTGAHKNCFRSLAVDLAVKFGLDVYEMDQM